MGYLVEIDDLQKRIIYPPRGMEFEPASVATPPDVFEKKDSGQREHSWQQEELMFTPNSESPRLLS